MCARKVYQIFQKFLGLYFCIIVHEKGTCKYCKYKGGVAQSVHYTEE